MRLIGYFLITIIIMYILVKIFSWPIKILGKLIINGLLGVILLMLVNLFGKYIGIHIAINAATALIAGFFGVPGIIFLIIFKMIL